MNGVELIVITACLYISGASRRNPAKKINIQSINQIKTIIFQYIYRLEKWKIPKNRNTRF